MEFRLLKADEIEARISQVSEKGVTLLLYKDARCDMNILDETVGPMNWQRHHTRDNANCIVSIWDEDKKMWIEKEDTGTESNTEKEKGLASDSFKRACFNFGIGRELYTAPFCFFPANECNFISGKCYDKFAVTGIVYDPQSRKINSVDIVNLKTGKLRTFDNRIRMPKKTAAADQTAAPPAAQKATKAAKQEAPKADPPQTSALEALISRCEAAGVNPAWVAGKCGVQKADQLDEKLILRCLNSWEQLLAIFKKEMDAA